MRAKRSKKYRKIMAAYNLHFSFRTPYQVLCDTNFLRQCHAFHMPVPKSLFNTLHGDSRPYITQCSLAKAMSDHRDTNQGKGRGDGKPLWLPPPLEVPLRYCKHKDEEGNDVGVLGETECFVDLIGGRVKGNEVPRNKEHYVVATAEEAEEEKKTDRRRSGGLDGKENPRKRKRRGGDDVRELCRQIPGVPVIYVKRSVMVLEELSAASERMIRGVEKAKFKEGLIGAVRGVKRKRDDEDGESVDDSDTGGVAVGRQNGDTRRQGLKKAKGPNPLSVRKKKVRISTEQTNGGGGGGGDNEAEGEGESSSKKRRKRKHAKKTTQDDPDKSTAGEIQEVQPTPAEA